MDIYELTTKKEQEIKAKGHILTPWKYYGGKSYYGSYNAGDKSALSHCELCKAEFSVDINAEHYDYDRQCPKNPKGLLKADYSADSIRVVTWQHCGICGKKLSSKGQVTTGFCGASNGCNNRSNNPKLRKGAKFYPLQKFPTPKTNACDYPVFESVLLQSADTDDLLCTMLTKGEKIYHCRVDGIAGNCDILVNYRAFLDYVTLLDDSDEITLSQDTETMILTLSHGNSRAKFKGMPRQELENISDMLGGNFEVITF